METRNTGTDLVRRSESSGRSDLALRESLSENVMFRRAQVVVDQRREEYFDTKRQSVLEGGGRD